MLFGLALAGAVAFVGWGAWIKQRVDPVVFEALAQLVLLAGLGGVGSLVVDEMSRGRERRQQSRERHQSVLSDIVRSYNEIKALRRRLRAEAVRPNFEDPDAVVSGKDYALLLQRLNDAQLNIEAHVRLIVGNRRLYADSEILIEGLGTAEKYLGKLLTEWEGNLGAFRGDPPEQSLAKLPVLRCFLGDADLGFGPGFADPVSKVFATLSRAIAK